MKIQKRKLREIMLNHNFSEEEADSFLERLSDEDARLIYIMVQKIAVRTAMKHLIKGSV